VGQPINIYVLSASIRALTNLKLLRRPRCRIRRKILIRKEYHMHNKTEERSVLLEKCEELANKPSILDFLGEEVKKRGFAGSADIPKLVYLVFLTGMLERPVSLVIKGPSGAGKSFSLEAGKQFIPPAAYEQFEGMSEKALVYLKGLDLKNKHLVIGEAAGLAEGSGRTLVRQLLSEGRVRYATVQSTSDGLEGSELPVLEGPTGLVMTTTATGLHPEDESRMLSVTMRESPEQILAALMAQASGTGKRVEPLDTGSWFTLYESVKSGPKEVAIPFAGKIAKRLPTTHDRIKRDFPQVLSLIKVHALLHSCTRDRSGDGRVIADAQDYAAVYDLVNVPLSEGLDVTVPDSIRRLVEAVREISRQGVKGRLSMAKLSEHLGRDISAISRSVKKAIAQGFLRDENPGQGREADLRVGDRKLPSGSVLPEPDELFHNEEATVSVEEFAPELA
jgi:hypothetical protein